MGARLIAGFAHVFSQRASAALAIGGDCPALDERVLRLASAALARPACDAVLGPALDGGYYLIGLTAPHPEVFNDIAWSTPQVLAQTRARFAATELCHEELPVLSDIDDEQDWRRAITDGLLPP